MVFIGFPDAKPQWERVHGRLVELMKAMGLTMVIHTFDAHHHPLGVK